MTWVPYSPFRLATAPPVCRDHPELFRAKVPLIYFNVVEWHRPDRVMRQFGLQQHIPEITPAEVQDHARLHKITRKGAQGERRWTAMHQNMIALWNNRVPFVRREDQPVVNVSQYMAWYRQITRRFITTPFAEASTPHHPRAPFVPHGGQVETVVSTHVVLTSVYHCC